MPRPPSAMLGRRGQQRNPWQSLGCPVLAFMRQSAGMARSPSMQHTAPCGYSAVSCTQPGKQEAPIIQENS